MRPWFHDYRFSGNAIKILTRLRTGHGLCGVKKSLFKISDSPICDVCGVWDNLQHIMLYCKKYKSVREKLFKNIKAKTIPELMSEVNNYRTIYEFYKSTELSF